MASSELKEKKFGYVVHPPLPPHYMHPPLPIPPGMTMQDWMTYINQYIDLRARQLYEKLKSLYSQAQEETNEKVHDFLLLKDKTTGQIHKVFIEDETIHSVPVGEEESREIIINELHLPDDLHFDELTIGGE